MKLARTASALIGFGLALFVLAVAPAAQGQAPQAPQTPAVPVAKLVAEPATLTLQTGESVDFKVTAYDATGKVIPNAAVRVNMPRRSAAFADGKVTAFLAGTFTATAVVSGPTGEVQATIEIPVTVTYPAVASVDISAEPGKLYAGVTLGHSVKVKHTDGSDRPGATATWKSSDPLVARVDRFGNVTGVKPGEVSISADVDGVRAQKVYTVLANPVASVDLGIDENTIRTGDVIKLLGVAKRSDGTAVGDAPITWSYTYQAPEGNTPKAPGGAAIIDNGLFVANYPGLYTILATSGPGNTRKTIEVTQRDVRKRLTITSRGIIRDTHTSDLWPFTGKDGRDYCIVGTWGGDGYAHIFDITDLNNIVKTDSVKVDARTINDVTVSPDARYAVLSREGASNRVNGVVILDLATPAHPKIASTFDIELTGGVHNMFATNDHLFAVSGGAKYVIINTEDLAKPVYVSEYRHPNARLHDLWVRDGIAYSAQGGVGTVVVDVGNGKWGGSLKNPKLINTVPINSGHEIYPYVQKSSGRTYLFIGDEEMNRRGRVWEGTNYQLSTPGGGPPPKGGIAQTSGGYTHIVDFTDPMNPRKVGRYQLEDYGSHDIIVENDVLYQAYYDGGVRVVDVSGMLLGNLYDQGREIAVFKPYDPEGYTANAPFVMNAMPWKGHVLFTDFNSGLWCGKLEAAVPSGR
ncbi:MAG TPA: Ig-like domain-containing protein [Vicinamibacterales bacterium]|nr:Ig-like domain-containing protein [Vicinamibacterales bacterium]